MGSVIGISAFYHDSAAALLCDGAIRAAAQEERFTRKKQDRSFPTHAISFCLEEAGLAPNEIDKIVFYESPRKKLDRLLKTFVTHAPTGFNSFRSAAGAWLSGKLMQRRMLLDGLREIAPEVAWEQRLLFAEHHQSHAASAFFPSPFERAIVLTLDGVGEWATTTVSIGEGNRLRFVKEIRFPHSLGMLYSAVTAYIGFRVLSGEYKVMGLAPYGTPIYKARMLEHLIDVKDDGSFALNMDYFAYDKELRMVGEPFEELFGRETRIPEDELLDQFHMDMAASVQAAIEEILLKMTRALRREYDIEYLCLAGGVALNCVANGKILRDGTFRDIWIQPASGDSGGALGAALAAQHILDDAPRSWVGQGDAMQGSYLGPAFSQAQIEAALTEEGARFEILDAEALTKRTAAALAEGSSVGWFQDRMEFGPRSLGNRSILGDARLPEMQKLLNLKIKYRESFRPFAPSVLEEDVADYFELDRASPYMLLVDDVKPELRRQMTEAEKNLFGIDKLNVPRSTIPAVTHVDYSARIQSVSAATNPHFHKLLSEFKALTNCSVLVNTSFNVRGEPIVCSPKDAFRCLMGTELDALAIGNCWVAKPDQDESLRLDYTSEFELD